MTTDTRGISALLLQRQLGMTRYETAWMMLHKFRRAMVNIGREPLRGEVETDDTWVGGPQAGLRGTGAPRTGIIDAVAFRIARGKSDVLDLRLVQLKGGNAGVSGREIARLKKADETVSVNWLIAAFDGEALHLVPDLES